MEKYKVIIYITRIKGLMMDIAYLTSSSRNGMCSCNEVYLAHKIPTDFIRAPLSATLSTAILSKQLSP